MPVFWVRFWNKIQPADPLPLEASGSQDTSPREHPARQSSVTQVPSWERNGGSQVLLPGELVARDVGEDATILVSLPRFRRVPEILAGVNGPPGQMWHGVLINTRGLSPNEYANRVYDVARARMGGQPLVRCRDGPCRGDYGLGNFADPVSRVRYEVGFRRRDVPRGRRTLRDLVHIYPVGGYSRMYLMGQLTLLNELPNVARVHVLNPDQNPGQNRGQLADDNRADTLSTASESQRLPIADIEPESQTESQPESQPQDQRSDRAA